MFKYYKLVYLLLFTFTFSSNLAQKFEFKIAGSPEKAILFQLEGEKTSKIDSIISQNDTFKFNLNGKHNGFYSLQFDNKHRLDFINDGKGVKISADFKNIKESLKVENSLSNKLYFEFIERNKAYKTKSELLNIILANYPKDDSYYNTTKEKLLEIQNSYQQFVEVTSQENPNSFIARYIKSAQLPIVKIDTPTEEFLTYLKKHSLDNVDFNDTEMIYSDLYTNKSIEYLTYYRNQQLPKALLEQEFMAAVDTLLNKAKVNELVYRHTTEYLIDGFTKFGFDVIINYIVDNYIIKDDLCLDAEIGSTIQKRIDQAKYFKIGSRVPNIVLPDLDGSEIDLSKIEAEKVLILFLASWCPYCKINLPDFVKLYNTQKEKKIEILAVSLDEDRDEWIKLIKDYKLNWLNVSDLKGWSGKTMLDYYIYATPTMFLVDKNRELISKPMTSSEIFDVFK
ncbi:MAG: redoxin domain-containing protein [Melioribacteraceae bacterium]|nr:redoxin domain-containing protein [Melioribacteraceae bacterium]